MLFICMLQMLMKLKSYIETHQHVLVREGYNPARVLPIVYHIVLTIVL